MIFFFIFLLKSDIVVSAQNPLMEAFLMSTHNLFKNKSNKKTNCIHTPVKAVLLCAQN